VAVRRAFLRLILVALLLAAQQTALTHAIWHAHGDASFTQQLDAADSDHDGELSEAEIRALRQKAAQTSP